MDCRGDEQRAEANPACWYRASGYHTHYTCAALCASRNSTLPCVRSANESEALAALAILETPPTPFPNRYRFIGLQPDCHYELTLVWPGDLRTLQSNHRDALADTSWSGDWLMSVGLSLPILQPESLLIYHLKAI